MCIFFFPVVVLSPKINPDFDEKKYRNKIVRKSEELAEARCNEDSE